MEETQKKISKSRLAAYVVALGAIALALFFFFRSNSLKKRLETSEQREAAVAREIEEYHELQRIDSLLVAGQYDSALKAYNDRIDNKDIEDASGVALRIDLARQMLKMRAGQHPSQTELALRDSLDSIQKQRRALPKEVQLYDSLNFALEKSKIQLANMRRQLQNSSTGQYLRFKNKKGSLFHYVGQVKNNQANGYGVALLNTGSRYEGQWRDNQRHGEGEFHWPDGEYYVGGYENDVRSGEGTYFWPNGEKYVGGWKNDKRSGAGTFYDKKGKIMTSGVWKDDKLVEENKKSRK